MAFVDTVDNTVSIVCGGQKLSGFTSFKIETGIDEVPARFEVSIAQQKGSSQYVALKTGQSFQMYIGADLVMSGYIGAYSISISGNSHTTSIRGDSKFADLMRCSAVTKTATPGADDTSIFGGGVLSGLSLGQIAQQFSSPFGLTVTGESPLTIPQYTYNLTESGYKVIATIAKYARKLFYDDTSGNVQLADVGTQKHSSGFVEGQNVEGANVGFDQSDEYSDYFVMWQNFNSSADLSPGAGFLAHGYASDNTVKRFKPLVIVSDQTIDGIDIGQAVAQWEMQRRLGRAQAVTIQTPQWRDSGGMLWTKNMLCTVNIPTLDINNVTWLIAKVAYLLDSKNGSICEVTLLPQSAFSVEPISLFPSNYDVIQNLQQQDQNSSSGNNINVNNVNLSNQNTDSGVRTNSPLNIQNNGGEFGSLS